MYEDGLVGKAGLRERTEKLNEANRRIASLLNGAVNERPAKLRAKVRAEQKKAKLADKNS